MVWHILILSLLQSITEFLPVSSSGHLILFPWFLGWNYQGLTIDIGMHLGTLLAVVVYFFPDLWKMLKAFVLGKKESKLVFLLTIATIPILVIALLFSYLDCHFRNPTVIASMLIIFGVALYLVDRYASDSKTIDSLSYKDAFWIGCGQCLSLIPGTSRSGICITAARLTGLNRTDSTRFSMLLSIPTIGAAVSWLLFKLWKSDHLIELDTSFFLGIVFCFFGGLVFINFLIKWVQKYSFLMFMLYRIFLGLLIFRILF